MLIRAGRAVLKDLSDDVRICCENAESCARKAVEQTDTELKQEYLILQQKWLSLAQSFQAGEPLPAPAD
jgi:hypothetical protein